MLGTQLYGAIDQLSRFLKGEMEERRKRSKCCDVSQSYECTLHRIMAGKNENLVDPVPSAIAIIPTIHKTSSHLPCQMSLNGLSE